MLEQMKKRGDLLFRIGIIVLWSLAFFYGMMWVFYACQGRNANNIEGYSYIWMLVGWAYRLFVFGVVIKGKGEVDRRILWGVWIYMMCSDLLSVFINGKNLIEFLAISRVPVSDLLGELGVVMLIATIFKALLLLVSYIFIIFKQRTKKRMLVQVICWGFIVVINVLLMLWGEMRMCRYKETLNFYSYRQSFFLDFTFILFWFWIMLKKEKGVIVSRYLKCPSCGKKMLRKSLFCSACGEKLPELSKDGE